LVFFFLSSGFAETAGIGTAAVAARAAADAAGTAPAAAAAPDPEPETMDIRPEGMRETGARAVAEVKLHVRRPTLKTERIAEWEQT
jgi:hypothetical protein